MAFSEAQVGQLKLLLQVQADAYNESLNRLYTEIKDLRNDYANDIRELQRSLEFTQKDFEDLKITNIQFQRENEAMRREVDMMKDIIDNTQKYSDKINDKFDFLEDEMRKTNIIVSGMPEEPAENSEVCHMKMIKLIKEKMEINNIRPHTVYRLGKKTTYQDSTNKYPRNILMKFSSENERNCIFNKKKLLKGTNIFLREDLSKGTTEARKSQREDLSNAIKQGKYAYFNFKTLVVKPKRTKNQEQQPQSASSSRLSPRVSDAINQFEKNINRHIARLYKQCSCEGH